MHWRMFVYAYTCRARDFSRFCICTHVCFSCYRKIVCAIVYANTCASMYMYRHSSIHMPSQFAIVFTKDKDTVLGYESAFVSIALA